MLPEKQADIIKKLDKLVSEAIEGFETSLNPAEAELYALLSDFAGSLKKNTNGTIKASVENLRLVERFRLDIDRLLNTGKYTSRAGIFMRAYSASIAIINEYFAATVTDFKANERLLKAILESGVDTTVESLLQSGVHQSFREPVIKLLKDNVTGNSSIVSLRKALKETIVSTEETPGLLTRHVKRIASDSLETFKRTYIQAISNDLNLQHFLYAGSAIETTRPFCKSRVGKYFTREQVESWPALEWSGKIPGTNKSTIYTVLAGYGCRHSLLPISRDLYEKRTA